MYTLKRRYIKGYRGAKNGRKKKTRYYISSLFTIL